MIVNIYPSECTLYQGEYIAAQWIDYRYYSRPRVSARTETGFIKVREPRPAIGVKAHLAILSEDERWLTLVDGNRYDAGHVLLMARIGKMGMSITAAGPGRNEHERG